MPILRLVAVVAVLLVHLSAVPAFAGCGCDKPPPPPAPIRPAFVPSGGVVTLMPSGLVAGQAYDVSFGGTEPVTATAELRRDFADGVEKPHLMVTVPELNPGPTAVTVDGPSGRVLTVAAADFTVLQAPLVLPEVSQVSVARCYRAAVGADGTVYFPFDIGAIGDRMLFSGAIRGWRFTFNASDIAIYNDQGMLMQLLGDPERDIFDIGDDATSTTTTTDAARTPSWPHARAVVPVAPTSTNAIDFDPDAEADLALFTAKAPRNPTPIVAASDAGTGTPATGGVVVPSPARAFGGPVSAVLSHEQGTFSRAGDRVVTAVDVHLLQHVVSTTFYAGILGVGGRNVVLQLDAAPTQDHFTVQVSAKSSGDEPATLVAGDPIPLTDHWLRLRTTFDATGTEVGYTAEVIDIGVDGTGVESVLATLTGAFDPAAIVGNARVMPGFGVYSPATATDYAGNLIAFDNFKDEITDVEKETPDESDPETPDDVDRSVKSYRLTYDRHEFLTYRAQHAIDEAFFLDPTDPAWHLNASRHIDHDHLIVAIHGKVAGGGRATPGLTPPFDLRLTTRRTDAAPGDVLPEVIQQRSCEIAAPAQPVCDATPATGCQTGLHPKSARLKMVNPRAAAGRSLTWAFRDGAAATATDFGNPITTDQIGLCVYDESGATPALRFSAITTPGTACARRGRRSRSCWRTVSGGRGFAYRDPSAQVGGLSEVRLIAGADGQTGIDATLRGEQLTLPPMPAKLPLRVQLQSSAGGCWEATYSRAGVKPNSARQFRGRSE